MKKICRNYHHFTQVYQKCTVPEIRSDTDYIFCHFGPFFALLPSSFPNDPKNQNFEKKKKKIEKCLEILSFYRHMCKINVDYMIYDS